MLFKSVCIHEKAAQHKIFSARDVVVVADLFDFLLGSSSLRIFYVACLLVPQQDFLILVCSLFSIHFTQSVLKYHIQNINFTIMNIIAITVFIHFFSSSPFAYIYGFAYDVCVSLHSADMESNKREREKGTSSSKRENERMEDKTDLKRMCTQEWRETRASTARQGKFDMCVQMWLVVVAAANIIILFKLNTCLKGPKCFMWPITLRFLISKCIHFVSTVLLEHWLRHWCRHWLNSFSLVVFFSVCNTELDSYIFFPPVRSIWFLGCVSIVLSCSSPMLFLQSH